MTFRLHGIARNGAGPKVTEPKPDYRFRNRTHAASPYLNVVLLQIIDYCCTETSISHFFLLFCKSVVFAKFVYSGKVVASFVATTVSKAI